MSEEKGRFILTFPLKTQPYQDEILYKRFKIGERLYNRFLDHQIKRYKEMTQTKQYRYTMDTIVSLSKEIQTCKDKKKIKELRANRKDAYQIIYDIKRNYQWSKFGFSMEMKEFRIHYKENLSSQICNNLAFRCYNAFEKVENQNITALLKGEDPSFCVHFKRKDSLKTLCGIQNTNGIRCMKTKKADVYKIVWQGLKFDLDISDYGIYDWQSFNHDICYCGIKRERIKGKWHYYVQITFKGNPPASLDKNTGDIKHPLGKGKVGLYFQTNTLTAVSENGAKKQFNISFADEEANNRLKELNTLMSNSRRALNPENYNEDGTVKQGPLHWKNSNRYKKYRTEYAEIYRKQRENKKLKQEKIANEIIKMGDCFACNDLSFKYLQGKIAKTIQDASPSSLKATIDRKLSYHDIEIKNISYVVLNEQFKTHNIKRNESFKIAELLIEYAN